VFSLFIQTLADKLSASNVLKIQGFEEENKTKVPSKENNPGPPYMVNCKFPSSTGHEELGGTI